MFLLREDYGLVVGPRPPSRQDSLIHDRAFAELVSLDPTMSAMCHGFPARFVATEWNPPTRRKLLGISVQSKVFAFVEVDSCEDVEIATGGRCGSLQTRMSPRNYERFKRPCCGLPPFLIGLGLRQQPDLGDLTAAPTATAVGGADPLQSQ